MEVLNLDELVKIERSVTIDGNDYPIEEMDVETFAAAAKEAKALEGREDLDDEVGMSAAVKQVHRVIPTLPEARIRKLKLPQLMALISFINSQVVEEAKKDTTGGAEGNAQPE